MAKILNRERLRKKLLALAPAIRAEIKPALEKGAQEIVDLAVHLAPVGATRALRNSIDWSYGNPPPGSVLHNGRKSTLDNVKNDLLISVYAGNDRAYYARWVEFGTQASTKGGRVADKRAGSSPGRTRKSYRTHPGTPAQSFFFPAYRATRASVKRRIQNATNKALKKVAQQDIR